MAEVLGLIADRLKQAEIPYEFGEWSGPVAYPYFVGSFAENDYRFEDGCTSGVCTLDGWSRHSFTELLEAGGRIKKAFQELRAVEGNRAFLVSYAGSMPAPSGEEGLFKITITLHTYEWEGD